ncbi:MAG: hypothetical protein WCE75_14455 [Terracidiphilus sp.]
MAAALAVVAAVLALAPAARAVSCTSQAQMAATDRDSIAAAGGRLAVAVVQQDFTGLQAALLPAVNGQWEGMRQVVEASAPLMKGGQAQLRNLYLLDATMLAAVGDAQFFCSNASGSMTVTLNLPALPPGRYAVVLADAAGSPLAGQMGFILVWDATGAPGWKLGGLTLRQGVLEGHDGVWWWSRARELARQGLPWAAWYCYEAARSLLVPVDFLSSPNLEKLTTEQAAIKGSPADAFPYTLVDGPRSWRINAVRLDPTLRQADLGVSFESTGITDPAAQRTEATAVLSALLKAKPGLRENFHGLWAYALKDGKLTPIIELPMSQIP